MNVSSPARAHGVHALSTVRPRRERDANKIKAVYLRFAPRAGGPAGNALHVQLYKITKSSARAQHTHSWRLELQEPEPLRLGRGRIPLCQDALDDCVLRVEQCDDMTQPGGVGRGLRSELG